MIKDRNGYIVVETIGTFIPFVLLMVSILSLVNIVAVQARIHYALTQAANTLSMYCYSLEVLGVANKLTTLDNKADRAGIDENAVRNDVSGVFTGIDSLSGNNGDTSRSYGQGEQRAGNPNQVLQLLMNYGLSALGNQVFEELARPLVGRYLANGDISGDEYLQRARVTNSNTGKTGLDALEFFSWDNVWLGNDAIIDSDGNIRLVVEYEVEYTFGGLPLPFKPTLRITQTAVTKAWLNGSGKGYW